VVFGLLCVAVGLFTPLPYLALGANAEAWADADLGLSEFYAERSTFVRATLLTHAVGAGVALFLTPVQASMTVRRRQPKLHRVSGRVSGAAIVVAAVSGLIVAPGGYAGMSGTIGFSALSLVWLYCLFHAINDARAKRLKSHRRWALRVIALTFAGVTLRLWTGLYIGFAGGIGGTDPEVAFDQAYPFMPFLAWIPNLLIIEWYLRKQTKPAPEERLIIAD